MAGFDEYLEDLKSLYGVRRRIDFLQRLLPGALAEYLAQELEDGVPVSWYDWLMEEV